MKTVFFETKGREKTYLKKYFKTAEFVDEPLTESNASKYSTYEIIGVFITSKINKTVLEKLRKTKIITTMSTGYDHIDIRECKKKGITVCNVPVYGENTVAEHTFALILTLSRKIHEANKRVQKEDFSTTGLEGFDLKGKTIGIIGTGHIGLHVIRIAKGFGMNVIAYDLYPNNFLAEVLGFKYHDMSTVMKTSDILTLHIPYNTETHHLINKRNINTIKKGALLINTARGALIETKALVEALECGTLNGIGIDVLEGEELLKEDKRTICKDKKQLSNLAIDELLINKPNVIYTPHIAFYSKEAVKRILDTTIQNIKSYEKGKTTNKV